MYILSLITAINIFFSAKPRFPFKNQIELLIYICLIWPFFEELLFWLLLPIYVNKYLVCIIFGLLHLVNYPALNRKVLINILLMMCLRYYLLSTNKFYYAFGYHCIHNMTIFIMNRLIVMHIYYKNFSNSEDLVVKDVTYYPEEKK